jgi:hypothetical protein
MKLKVSRPNSSHGYAGISALTWRGWCLGGLAIPAFSSRYRTVTCPAALLVKHPKDTPTDAVQLALPFLLSD